MLSRRRRRGRRQRRWALLLVFLIVAPVLIYIFYTELRPVVIFGLRDDYAHAIPFQQVPVGLDSLNAEECGRCHQDIYKEWKASIHAHAYEDPFFQAYWKKDDNIWICLNCHTPLENQQPTLIQKIPNNRVEKAIQVENPMYDQAFQQEGVTCAACHVRDGVIYGPFDDSVAPHPTEFDPAFRTTSMCYRCHNVVSGPFQFYNVGPCGTYAEYEGEFFSIVTCRKYRVRWRKMVPFGRGVNIFGEVGMIPKWSNGLWLFRFRLTLRIPSQEIR